MKSEKYFPNIKMRMHNYSEIEDLLSNDQLFTLFFFQFDFFQINVMLILDFYTFNFTYHIFLILLWKPNSQDSFFLQSNSSILDNILILNMSFLKPPRPNTSYQNNYSTLTEYKAKRKCPTFVTSISKSILRFDNVEQNLEIIKISLKKQVERRNKLKKLLDKYSSIYCQEKKNLKVIKSFIIEMKDATAACKLKLFFDPTIIVQNMIKVETRQFFCTLMNTFYKTYDKNEQNNKIIKNLNSTLGFLIKGISYNEDKIFLMQKTQINEQALLQGQLLTEKNRLKQEAAKRKQIKKQFEQVQSVYLVAKEKYEQKKDRIQSLRNKLRELNQHSQSLQRNIQFQENIRNQCKDQINAEMIFKQKLSSELKILDKQTSSKNKESNKLLKKLYQSRVESITKEVARSNSKKKENKTVGEIDKQKIKFSIQQEFSHLRF